MELLTILLISLALAMDAFTVSVSVGTCCLVESRRGKLRLAAHFGIFQAGMTALGWVMGETIVGYVAQFDHWIAFALLVYVGTNLIRSGFGLYYVGLFLLSADGKDAVLQAGTGEAGRQMLAEGHHLPIDHPCRFFALQNLLLV